MQLSSLNSKSKVYRLQSCRNFVRGFLRMMSSFEINRLLRIARQGSLTS